MTSSAISALSQWSLDREIVLSRVIDAPRDLVFQAWTDPRHLPQWFGPAGFKIETKEIDVRVGGLWRFDMIAPDGTLYPNRMRFLRIEKPRFIEIDHGSDKDEDPGMFRTTITFESQSDGKTVLTMRQLHPTVAQREAGIGFGAVEYGYQTLDKLAAYVAAANR
ncbi:SRPBCC family protein [Bradyrhizobium liaoningense]|uniref:SRPBCC family protein n=1 Tax=Bradyrhizobium liaoningense TaxID=43992 RepID=UPI001BAC923C|nr:SRPBCC family protein [Bradyrhizobium liaoningense]MBR0716068.1 SRPBCC family protein [Bradyrhizobium liaoningense]